MARIIGGTATRQGLLGLATQLLAIYQALETASRAMSGDPVFGAFDDRRLDRVPSLRADLAVLGFGLDPAPLLPATLTYTARIQAVADSAPTLLAHHYTRYLGDLSGGQALGAISARSLGIAPGNPGVSFYHFSDILKVKPYKDRYRDLLDSAELDPAGMEQAVDEARLAFDLNRAVFGELEALDQR